ncbi:putative lipoprotein [Escherichia coli H617]|nr:hypothetical protein FORC31_4619 [Escherichia coli]EFI90100.1 hypothetical protein HMPREF9551_00859 [Escherichia coli MS 196-1]EFU98292.1 hypothetical protein EC3431_2070 [Escherichia coli 3431]EGB30799.1 hypothetical protein ERCG_04237 [Escherichia coli E1520]EGI08328.1 putative lipoprotein [Escherichia coli H736]EHV55007.1 hypothetical protein ECDEC6C_4638 [Escherichia coli DEC6C]EMW27723.1 putative lipoprotein [Escherichia coli 2845350]ENA74037.1 putative lipoprotein [Escherichia coli 
MNFIILFINKMRVVAFSFFIYYVHSLIYIFIRQLNEKEFIIFRYYSRHHVPRSDGL